MDGMRRSTLPGLEAPVRLVDDIEAAAPAHDLIVAVPLAKGTQ
jgi:hypothetical protein